MYDPAPFKTHLPGTISLEGLNIIFHALTQETRDVVIAELTAAQRDTSVEYHKTPVNDSGDLASEVLCLNMAIVAGMEAANDFQDESPSEG